jgi:hypothetical protein
MCCTMLLSSAGSAHNKLPRTSLRLTMQGRVSSVLFPTPLLHQAIAPGLRNNSTPIGGFLDAFSSSYVILSPSKNSIKCLHSQLVFSPNTPFRLLAGVVAGISEYVFRGNAGCVWVNMWGYA